MFFNIKDNKTRLIISGILFILGIFIILQISLFQVQDISPAQAALAHKVRGWGWSENIGWISMNCYNDYSECNGGPRDGLWCLTTDDDCLPSGICEKLGDFENCCPGGNASECPGGLGENYGVHYNTTNGKLTGYAWADGVGWICFGEDCQTVCLGGSNNGAACTVDGNCPDGECGGKPPHGLPVSWACVGRPGWYCTEGERDACNYNSQCIQWDQGVCRFSCSDDAGEDFVDSNVCVRSSHLKAHWKMNSITEGTIADDSVNENTGTLMPVSTPPIQSQGKFSNGLQFDGDEDYIEVADSPSLSPVDNLTVEAWIKRGQIGSEQTIVGKWDESTGIKSYRLWFSSSNNKLNFSVSDGTNTATAAQKNGICVGNNRKVCDGGSNHELPCNDYTAAEDCPDGYCREPFCVVDSNCDEGEICKNAPIIDTTKWHHVTGKYVAQEGTDNPKLHLFIDGSPIHAGIGISETIPNNLTDKNEKLYIGAKEGDTAIDTYFKGIIDNVSVWSCPNIIADRTKGRSDKEIWDDARIELDGWARVINLGEKGWLKLKGLTKDGRVWGSSLDYYSTFYTFNGYLANRWVDESGGDEEFSTTSLVSYYKMDEKTGTLVSDSSSNNLNANTYNMSDTDWQVGKYGNSLHFTRSSSDYALTTTTDLTNFTKSDAFTVSAWVYNDTVSGDWQNNTIVGNTNCSDNYKGWQTSYSELGNFQFNVGYHDGTWHSAAVSTTNTYDLSTWYHVIFVYTGVVGEQKIYVNGQETDVNLTNNTDTFSYSGNQALYVGKRGSCSDSFMDGRLDEIRIYSRALSPLEASQLYAWAPGPVGHWKMNEPDWDGTSNEVLDASGNTNHGTAYNGADVTNQGIFNSAGDFDGVNDYVSVADSSTLDLTSGVTIEAWIKPETIPANGRIVSKRYDSSWDSPYIIYDLQIISASNAANMGVTVGSTRYTVSSNTDSINTNYWYHIAGTYDGETMKIYVNGEYHNQNTAPSGNIVTNNEAVTIGISDNGNSSAFNGFIDNVAVYNRALTSTEIQAAYNKSIPACVGWEDYEHEYDDPPEPLSFDNLTVNSGSVCSQLLVYWDASDWAENYTYWRCDNISPESDCSSCSYTERNVLAGSCTETESESECSLLDTGLVSNTGYCYKIQAHNEIGSTWSTDNQPTHPSPYWKSTTLCAPVGLDTDASTCGQIISKWYRSMVCSSGTEDGQDCTLGATACVDGGGTCIEDSNVDGYNIYRSLASDDCDSLYDSRCELTGHLGEAMDYYIDNDSTNDLIAQWKMNETNWSGDTDEVADSSAQTPLNNGTAIDADISNGDGDTPPTTIEGIFNKAGDFDGTDDYVEVTSDGTGIFDNQEFTISAWVNKNSIADETVIFSYDYTSHEPPYYGAHMRFTNTTLYLMWNDGTDYQNLSYVKSDLAIDTWYHVVGTYKSGEQKLYINGNEVNSSARTDTITFYNQEVWIGRANYGGYFNGQIDNVSIYNVAKTAEQIKIDYESGTNSNCESGQCGLAYVCDDGTEPHDKCGTADTCCYTDSRVIPYVNYYYRVTATGETGETPASEVIIDPVQTICFPALEEEEE